MAIGAVESLCVQVRKKALMSRIGRKGQVLRTVVMRKIFRILNTTGASCPDGVHDPSIMHNYVVKSNMIGLPCAQDEHESRIMFD